MGSKPEARFRFIQERAEFVEELEAIAGKPLSTLSPEHHFPGSGVFMQRKFTELFEGDSPKYIPAMDIRNQCSGFLYGLGTASSMVQCGALKHVLVVGEPSAGRERVEIAARRVVPR